MNKEFLNEYNQILSEQEKLNKKLINLKDRVANLKTEYYSKDITPERKKEIEDIMIVTEAESEILLKDIKENNKRAQILSKKANNN